jgi:hypothetical protein
MTIAIVQETDVPFLMKNPKKQTHNDLIDRIKMKREE